MNRFFTRRMWCLAIVLGVALMAAGLLTSPATGGKPGGGSTPPPPVQYTMTLLDVPVGSSACYVRGMNNQGDVLGAASFSVEGRSFEYPVVWWMPSADTWQLIPDLGDTLAELLIPSWPEEWVNGPAVFGSETFGDITTHLEIRVSGINAYGELCGEIHFARRQGQVTLSRFDAAFRTLMPPEELDSTLDPDGQVEVLDAAVVNLPAGYVGFLVYSINSEGDVAGRLLPDTTISLKDAAFVWWSGSSEWDELEIGAGAYRSGAFGIDDSGDWVAGWMGFIDESTANTHAFVFDTLTGATRDLTVLAGPPKTGYSDDGHASDVNGSGLVVGETTFAGLVGQRAFLYTPPDATHLDGQIFNLGVLKDSKTGSSSCAGSINDQGQVVGVSSYWTAKGTQRQYFLYTKDTGMLDLWSLIASSPITATDFIDATKSLHNLYIRDCAGRGFGRICGYTYVYPYRPYVLTPDK